MARPVSWLPRLLPSRALSRNRCARTTPAPISNGSSRFSPLRPDADESVATVRIGKSLLVEREVLAACLAGCRGGRPRPRARVDAGEAKPPMVRRKLRELVQRDSAGDSSLPPCPPRTGALTVQFTTVEELAAALWRLAILLDEDLDGFASAMNSFQRHALSRQRQRPSGPTPPIFENGWHPQELGADPHDLALTLAKAENGKAFPWPAAGCLSGRDCHISRVKAPPDGRAATAEGWLGNSRIRPSA